MNTINENLVFAEGDLREALNKASSVESIVILQLIKNISSARNDTLNLLTAINKNNLLP